MKQRSASSFSFIEPMNALLVTALPAGDWEQFRVTLADAGKGS